jgi:virginiamycin B lyase
MVTSFTSPQAGSMVPGPDGNLWTISPAQGLYAITAARTASMFTPPALGAHGAALGAVAVGPDSNIWFTERELRQTDPEANRIGRLELPSTIDEFKVCSGPLAITAGADGNLWYTTDKPVIGRITPAGKVTEFPLRTVTTGTLWTIASSAGTAASVWVLEDDGTIARITPP